ncbi:Type II secretion system protein F [compost metagenome]
MGLSKFLTRSWILVLLVAGAIYIIKKFMLDRDETYIEKRDFNRLKIPVFGEINKQIVSARFAKTLSILISSGLGVIQSLEISAKVVGNLHIKNKLNLAKEDIKKGNAIGKTLEDMQLFPLMLTQMINLGEETGTLEEVLERTSKFYDGEVENATSKLVSSIEPMMIVILSAIVLIIVLSMILPLTSMMEGINNIQR